MAERQYTLLISRDDDGSMWGEFKELPGCFVSGADMDELTEAASEALSLYLQESEVEENKVVSLGTRRKRAAAKSTPKPPVPRELIMEA